MKISIHHTCDDFNSYRAARVKSLFPLGVEMLSRAVAMIAGGNVPRIPQDERFATWEPQYAATRLYRPELLRLT